MKTHIVQSQSDPEKAYVVTVEQGDISCTCDGFLYRNSCSHATFIHDKHYPDMPQGGEQKDGGAFWYATSRETGERKMTRNGKPYMTGSIVINGVKHDATLFFTAQADKKNPRQPDINILFRTPQGGQEMDAVKDRMKNVPQPAGTSGEEEIRVEDIPF